MVLCRGWGKGCGQPKDKSRHRAKDVQLVYCILHVCTLILHNVPNQGMHTCTCTDVTAPTVQWSIAMHLYPYSLFIVRQCYLELTWMSSANRLVIVDFSVYLQPQRKIE